jgi:3-hydroxyacyl-CoA dehydrogenase
MGSGIAAHLANLGLNVTLLDLTAQSVRTAFDKAKTARPPHFYIPGTADTVRLGSIEENLDWVSEADWVCEAIVEKLEAKKSLFARIEPLMKPDAIVTTNTSGLQISLLAADQSQAFRRVFMGTHFFNPPRYLKLLELIPTPDTSPQAIEAMTRFLEDKCARRVVIAKDTPGFIANRFGMWSMIYAVHVTERLGLSIEEVDAITGAFIGRPNSGSF